VAADTRLVIDDFRPTCLWSLRRLYRPVRHPGSLAGPKPRLRDVSEL
jgi:hypothetical protein